MFGYIKNMFTGLLNDWKTGSFGESIACSSKVRIKCVCINL